MGPFRAATSLQQFLAERLWALYLVLGTLAAIAFLVLPAAGRPQAVVFCALGFTAPVAVVAGVLRNRPQRPLAWFLIAVGLGLYAVADIGFFRGAYGFPSWVDYAYLSSYGLLVLGFVLIVRQASAGRQWMSLVDTAIVALGLGVLVWILAISPNLFASGISPFARSVAAAYPIADVLMLGVLALMLFTSTLRVPACALLGLGIFGQLASDIPFALRLLAGDAIHGAPYFVGWILMLTAVGAAALHPSMAELSRRRVRNDPVASKWKLGVLGVSALIPPVTGVLAAVRGVGRLELGVSAAFSAVLFLLVLVRMAGLMSEIARYRRLERLKDEFTSIVSHELRTPLTSIRGALGLLAGGVLAQSPEKAERMVQIALTSTDRLVRLINDILDIDRMESGRASLQMSPCDLAGLAGQAREQMQAMADEAGVAIVVDAEPLTAELDADRILQTLTNLMSNAIKFSPAATTITVAVRREGADALVTVTDQGRGIPEDQLEAVFLRFQQVDASDSRNKGGTGLGLAICRKIVEQHGGGIWAQAAPGGGSMFAIRLPAGSAPLPEAPVAPEVPADARGRMILVCDDDARFRIWISDLLRGEGYAVVEAASGPAALEAARRLSPDVIVMDLVMPGMGGWEIAAALQREPRISSIPVVVMSALAPDRAEAPEGRIVDWLTKPVDRALLATVIERALAGSRRGARVLVVEDDDGLARVLSAGLERRGLQVRHAGSVAAAIRLADGFAPDVVMLDLMLSDGDGRKVLAWLGAHPRLAATPVLVYSATDDDSGLEDAISSGRVSVLSKGRVAPAVVEEKVLQLVAAAVAGRGR